jgi:hypothetical protein
VAGALAFNLLAGRERALHAGSTKLCNAELIDESGCAEIALERF